MSYPTENREYGFTLVELIVAIAILVLLAGIATPLVKGALEDAKVAQTLSMISSIKQAVHKYWQDTGSFPIEQNPPMPEIHDLFTNSSGVAGWRGPYIDRPLTISGNPLHTEIWLSKNINGSNPTFPGYLVAGRSLSNNGSQLMLRWLPVSIAQKIDLQIDGVLGQDTGAVEVEIQAADDGEPMASVFIFLLSEK